MRSLLINAALLVVDTNRVPRSKINLDPRFAIASPLTKLSAVPFGEAGEHTTGYRALRIHDLQRGGAIRMERCGGAQPMSVLLLVLLVVVVIVTRIHGGLTVPRGITWVT